MTEPPATGPPADTPDDATLIALRDRLTTEPAIVAELLADPGGWARAHQLGDDQLDRLRVLVTERAAAVPPDHRRPLLAAAFALVRRPEHQGSSGPSTSISSNRDDTPSLR